MQDSTGTEKRYTYEDYLKLDDGREYEVIEGELIVVPKPRPNHQRIAGRIVTILNNYLWQKNLGEVYIDVDVIFGDQVVSPDIIYISQERLSIVSETNIQGPPDLVIEVLSPSTQKYDRKKKSSLYYAGGVKEYWIVDPELQLVEVFVSGENDWNRSGIYDEEDILITPVLQGLRIELKNIF